MSGAANKAALPGPAMTAWRARGRHVAFLNNDTRVEAGWLDALRATFDSHPRAGLVGSKLLFPDGRLQEASGSVFADGSVNNHGRGDDPARPAYNELRSVDYVSGASIMIPTALMRRLGGFDLAYSPAYYEDVDLAFRVRQAGYSVLYQPLSRLVHFESVTSGLGVNPGASALLEANRRVFLARWGEVLAGRPPPGVPRSC
jgi:GT2 family glycosyltransferase